MATTTIDVAAALAFVDALNARWDAEEFERLVLADKPQGSPLPPAGDGTTDMAKALEIAKANGEALRGMGGNRDRTDALIVQVFLTLNGADLSALQTLKVQRALDELCERYPAEWEAALLRVSDDA